jgi:hypothetical protein
VRIAGAKYALSGQEGQSIGGCGQTSVAPTLGWLIAIERMMVSNATKSLGRCTNMRAFPTLSDYVTGAVIPIDGGLVQG